jgi:toxin ParE1/3/4
VTELRWTNQAVEDVRAIRAFIERDSLRYGCLVAERIVDATGRIELFPRSGRVVPEFSREDVREIIVGEYRIVYRLMGDIALLLTVFRSSRLVPVLSLDPE